MAAVRDGTAVWRAAHRAPAAGSVGFAGRFAASCLPLAVDLLLVEARHKLPDVQRDRPTIFGCRARDAPNTGTAMSAGCRVNTPILPPSHRAAREALYDTGCWSPASGTRTATTRFVGRGLCGVAAASPIPRPGSPGALYRVLGCALVNLVGSGITPVPGATLVYVLPDGLPLWLARRPARFHRRRVRKLHPAQRLRRG